jgi:hypothetical protein
MGCYDRFNFEKDFSFNWWNNFMFYCYYSSFCNNILSKSSFYYFSIVMYDFFFAFSIIGAVKKYFDKFDIKEKNNDENIVKK